MKNKILVVSILVIVSTLAANAYAVGQDSGAGTDTQTQQQTQTVNQGEDSQIQVQDNEQVQSGSGTDEQVQNQNQEQNQEQVPQQQQQQGQINAEQHRSTVANFIQSLNGVAADREGGVGQQVRTIAQQQNQSEGTTVQAMEKVQTRSKVKTFFFGSDYKNLGVLRSEMVQTRNRLEQLNQLIENVQNEGDQTELQNQIQTLEQEQVKIENFIKVEEGKFSLFGWLVKLFN